jgi:hypothetical protein
MKELKINTKVKPESASAMIVCNCGALIMFNALDVRQANKLIVECEVCRTQLLLIDSAFDPGCI